MMEPPGGTALVEESIVEALDFRRAMRKVEDEFGDDDWWFEVWGPEALAEEGVGTAQDWIIRGTDASTKTRSKKNGKEFDNWHGFGDLADGFNMLDPIKSTIVTPGLDLDGDFADTGIPASIVTKYLAEHGVVVEKTGLYSFFIMFTIGITKGRWNTMLTALQQFKDDYDRNQPLARILPEFCQQHRRYERMGLKDLCQHVHELYAKYDIARLTTEMYLSDLKPTMKPSDAYAHIAQRKTERVEIDHLVGRTTVGLVTPYPPGIPLLIPGEVFNKKIVDYLVFAREFAKECPGFETDIHGLVEPGRRKRRDPLLRGLRRGDPIRACQEGPCGQEACSQVRRGQGGSQARGEDGGQVRSQACGKARRQDGQGFAQGQGFYACRYGRACGRNRRQAGPQGQEAGAGGRCRTVWSHAVTRR